MARLREDVITLSSGSIWPWLIPAEPGDEWPDGANCWTVFKNSAGAELTTVEAIEVTPTAVKFLAQPDEVAMVPSAAGFETFIDSDDGPFKIRYGIVNRKEARAFNVLGTTVEVARKFEDTLQRTGLGWRWEVVSGRTRIYNNSLQSLGYGVGPDVGLLSNKPSAIRWHQPLAMDTVRSNFTITMPLSTFPPFFGASNGQTTNVICADQTFTTGLGLQVDSVNNQLHMCRITSPTTVVYVGAAVSNTPVSNDNYTAVFNLLTNTLSIYDGTTLVGTPWVDTTHIVPHGPGYRYTGFMFKPTILETGPQVSGWAAKDEV